MKKIIIEIDDKQYEDAINDTEWDTLSLGIYLKEQVKNGKPLETEFEKAKAEMKKRRDALDNGDLNDYKKCKMQGYSDSMGILDHYIEELKGENK